MNIYVANLGLEATDDELRNLFTPYGEVVSAGVVIDKFTSRCKGFGFVEMPDKQSAQNAIAALKGTLIGGRSLIVNEARPRRY